MNVKKLFLLIIFMIISLPIFGMEHHNPSVKERCIGLVLVGIGTSIVVASMYGISTKQTIGFIKKISPYALPMAMIAAGAYYVIQTNKAIAKLNEKVKTLKTKLTNKNLQFSKATESKLKTVVEKLNETNKKFRSNDEKIKHIEDRYGNFESLIIFDILQKNQQLTLLTQQTGRVEKKVDQVTQLMGTYKYLNDTAEELIADDAFKKLIANATKAM